MGDLLGSMEETSRRHQKICEESADELLLITKKVERSVQKFEEISVKQGKKISEVTDLLTAASKKAAISIAHSDKRMKYSTNFFMGFIIAAMSIMIGFLIWSMVISSRLSTEKVKVIMLEHQAKSYIHKAEQEKISLNLLKKSKKAAAQAVM